MNIFYQKIAINMLKMRYNVVQFVNNIAEKRYKNN